MDHKDIRHMLSKYIDGAVSAEDKAAIEAHLRTCGKCSEALRELRQTVAHLKTVEEIDPPAWMTQKIMARVRAEAEKKSWLQRLFFPLPAKLPLEAIGVLFIAVTALFIYQNMHPSQKAAKPRFQDQMPGAEKRQADTTDGENYQSLLSKEKTDRGIMQERTAASAGAAHEASMKAKPVAPAAPTAGALSADKSMPAIVVKVKDVAIAAGEVEKAIAQVRGSIVRRESSGPRIVFFVTISAERTAELVGKLKLLGEVRQEPREGTPQKDPVEFRIEITRKL